MKLLKTVVNEETTNDPSSFNSIFVEEILAIHGSKQTHQTQRPTSFI